jgi:DNA polymerase III epsilon subunit-like protein
MPTLPTYPWFDQVPEHLKTRRQLAEQGLRPGGPVVAQVVWRRGERWADLYDLNAAEPKREMTEAQRAALAKAQQALRTCSGCGTVFSFVLYRGFDCPVCCERMLTRDRAAAARQARIWLRSPRTVIIDTETTELDGYLVQIAVIRAHDGVVLLDTLVNPQTPISAGARRIHGISDEQVKDAPTFERIAEELLELLRGKRIVTYNADFDRRILVNEFRRLDRHEPTRRSWAWGHRPAWDRGMAWRCAMELYAQFCGDWSDHHNSYRWQPLPAGDHSALGDARACRAVLAQMAEEFGNVRNQQEQS